PEDWPLLISAEQKTNPRLMETIGNIDLIPATRRVGGAGASYLMAPFTHTSTDRPSRFSDGRLGVLYIANDFETAVHETAHHHGRFLVATNEKPGWVSQFRELLISVVAALHDIRSTSQEFREVLDLEEYTRSQNFADSLRSAGSEGVVYPSVRGEGECVELFYPYLAQNPVQVRHLAYHWDGTRVDLIRDATTGDVFRIVDP
ncbi:MAG: RES family NAD+ phosphorylase, partial [Hyphomicrobiales bacterium]